MISTEFTPWARIGSGRLLVIPDEGPARVEPPAPATSCQHPSGLFSGYGFARVPERYVAICPDCLTILGDPIIRSRR